MVASKAYRDRYADKKPSLQQLSARLAGVSLGEVSRENHQISACDRGLSGELLNLAQALLQIEGTGAACMAATFTISQAHSIKSSTVRFRGVVGNGSEAFVMMIECADCVVSPWSQPFSTIA